MTSVWPVLCIAFMMAEPSVIDYIDGDETVFEQTPLNRLAAEGEIAAYRHNGFWQCMDTAREKERLEAMIADGTAPWIKW